MRSRPDIAVVAPCRFSLSWLWLQHDAVIYQWDYIVAMPQKAATMSLQQVPMARQVKREHLL